MEPLSYKDCRNISEKAEVTSVPFKRMAVLFLLSRPPPPPSPTCRLSMETLILANIYHLLMKILVGCWYVLLYDY